LHSCHASPRRAQKVVTICGDNALVKRVSTVKNSVSTCQKPCNFTGPSKSLFWWHQGVRNLQPCVADGPRYSQNIPSRVLLTRPASWCKVEHGTGSEPCHRVTTQNVRTEPTGKNGQISATFGSWANTVLPSRQVVPQSVCTKWYSGTRGHTLVTFAAIGSKQVGQAKRTA